MSELFTRREREVGRLLADGMTGPEIAAELELSPKTVRNYVHRMAKLLPGSAPPMRRIALHFAHPERTQDDLPG